MNWLAKNPIRVATHGCPQHLDELVAIYLLKQWAQDHGSHTQVHFLSRHEIETDVDGFDALIDIGGRFDPERGRFDHHQGGADVEGRSSAGLVFDTLYADDPRRGYLEPIIHHVDAIDTGTLPPRAGVESDDRGPGMVSVPSLIKAIGGFHHNPPASRRCLETIEPLVASWFTQADAYLQAAHVVTAAERVGEGVFLDSDEPYGPGLLEYVQRETPIRFIGFPAEKNRYQVVAVRDRNGHNRVNFTPSLEGATFVHPKGFMAVFEERDDARRSLAS